MAAWLTGISKFTILKSSHLAKRIHLITIPKFTEEHRPLNICIGGGGGGEGFVGPKHPPPSPNHPKNGPNTGRVTPPPGQRAAAYWYLMMKTVDMYSTTLLNTSWWRQLLIWTTVQQNFAFHKISGYNLLVDYTCTRRSCFPNAYTHVNTVQYLKFWRQRVTIVTLILADF